MGLVGESGCGKSTLGKTVIRLLDSTDGSIEFQGSEITKLDSKALKDTRRDFQMIFQDPFSSLNPRMTVEQILLEPYLIHKIATKDKAREEIKQILADVGPPADVMKKYPTSFQVGKDKG